MDGGVPEIGVSELADGGPGCVVDVREDGEWAAGHIDGARHIPMMQLPTRLGELPADDRIVVVCRSGHRSAHVVGFLLGQGYDAVNLAGGMQSWAGAGRPMVAPPGRRPFVP